MGKAATCKKRGKSRGEPDTMGGSAWQNPCLTGLLKLLLLLLGAAATFRKPSFPESGKTSARTERVGHLPARFFLGLACDNSCIANKATIEYWQKAIWEIFVLIFFAQIRTIMYLELTRFSIPLHYVRNHISSQIHFLMWMSASIFVLV